MMKIVMAVVTAVMMTIKTAQTREITMKRNLTPIDLKTFFEDSDYELTDHHSGADGEFLQLIHVKREARKYARMLKEKAYLSGRL